MTTSTTTAAGLNGGLRPESLTPAQARDLFRSGTSRPTSGFCPGFTQANLLAVPKEFAFDFLLFAQRNPKACPVLDVLEPGQTGSAMFAGGDIRTDIGRYRVFHDGQVADEPTSVADAWRDDMVGFLIGCSFTFEAALIESGIAIAHMDQGVNVPMYKTSIATAPAGRFAGPTVVSMRPIPASRVADAVRITSRYPSVHGAPIHIGDPGAIGIADLAQPDFGDSVTIPDGSLPVFWACGVTPQAAVMASRIPVAITHAPGYMLITDIKDSTYQVP